MQRIDLNCDLGEHYGNTSHNLDHQIMPFISSCNIACGFHSGDPLTIEKTILSALEHEVAIGAHPSFPDLMGFGRRVMLLPLDELKAIVRYQVAALKGMTKALGGTLNHVKPHGALYNFASTNADAAKAILEAVQSISDELKLYGPPNSEFEKMAQQKGIAFVREGFADRAYENDLSLRSRTLEGAVLHGETAVLQQVNQLVFQQQIQTYQGELKALMVDSICLHSDTTNAIHLSQKIHQTLTQNGVEICHPQ